MFVLFVTGRKPRERRKVSDLYERSRVLKGSERVSTREADISSGSALVFYFCDVSCESRQNGEPGIRCKKGWGTVLECNGAKTACKKVNVGRHHQENRTEQNKKGGVTKIVGAMV
jgi:hypothetical protein